MNEWTCGKYQTETWRVTMGLGTGVQGLTAFQRKHLEEQVSIQRCICFQLSKQATFCPSKRSKILSLGQYTAKEASPRIFRLDTEGLYYRALALCGQFWSCSNIKTFQWSVLKKRTERRSQDPIPVIQTAQGQSNMWHPQGLIYVRTISLAAQIINSSLARKKWRVMWHFWRFIFLYILKPWVTSTL